MCLRNNGFFKETFLQSLVATTSRKSGVKIIWGGGCWFVCFKMAEITKGNFDHIGEGGKSYWSKFLK